MAGGDGKATNDTKAPPVQYQFAQKPEEKPGWEGFKQFLWNSETSEFLGRTASSWFKICLFYLVYYTFLTGFFIAMLVVFYQTLDEHVPKWQNSNGIIGSNPGVGFRPKPIMDNVDSTLVFYRQGTTVGTWKTWVDSLDEFLADYKNAMKKPKSSTDLIDCSFSVTPGEGQICLVNATNLITGPCTEENKYGFVDGKPCILLKLNRIFGWVPTPYNSTKLPEDMPKNLKDFIKEKETGGQADMASRMVWFSCEGENPADKENLGKVDWYPYPGVPDYFFPYEKQPGYLSPAVFAHLTNPKHHVLISVTCKAWAKNIHHNTMERQGSAHFELMID